jgi:N-acetylneuraminic acid mutarotase
MKKSLFIFLALSSSLLGFSQGSWSPRTPLPDSARALGIGFSIGNYGYVGLGYDDRPFPHQYFKDFWRFDPSSNTWTKMANFPGRASIAPATFVIGKYAYVITGGETVFVSNFLTECWQYNSATNQWTQKANFPGVARYDAIGFAIGGKGFVGTGYDTINSSPLLRDMWEYDTTSDSWTRKNDFGGGVRYCASAFTVGSNGYVCFGIDSIFNSFSTLNDMWEYDTTSDSWTQKKSNPLDSLGFTSGFVIGSDIYVGTGQKYSNDEFYNDFWKYNIMTDTWVKKASLPGDARGASSAFAIDDTGYLGIGEKEQSGFVPFDSLYRYIPDTLPTGINNISNISDVVLYPNPFKTFCNIILLVNSNDSKAIFILYDLEGNEIKPLIRETGNNYIISREGLQTGVYILSIQFNNQIIHKKLLITN